VPGVPCGAGMGSGRRTPYCVASDGRRLWGARLGTKFCPACPKGRGRGWRGSKSSKYGSHISVAENLKATKYGKSWQKIHSMLGGPYG
jgi:hypothetical protein